MVYLLEPSDPESESRGNVLTIFYIPRDERFDQVKFSDFAADAVRDGSHKLIPTLKTAAGYGDQEFINFADIKSLYVSTDSTVTGALDNLEPQGAVHNELTALSNQNPLTFVHEYAFPSGSDTDHITYPLPAIIAGALLLAIVTIARCSSHRQRSASFVEYFPNLLV